MYKDLIKAIVAVAVIIAAARAAKGRKAEKAVLLAAAAVFLTGLFYCVMIRGGRNGLSGVSFKLPLPFWHAVKAGHYGITTNRSVLNILLFVPFGYLLPRFITLAKPGEKVRWWQITALGFIASLLIETAQLVFSRGIFELDDLVKNTLGAAAGYALWRIMDRSDGV